jgi:microcystin-dependent protein
VEHFLFQDFDSALIRKARRLNMKLTKMLLTALAISLFALNGLSDVPLLLNYQGRLLATNGVPVQAVVSITVRIYSQPTGSSPLYVEDIGAVIVENGTYSFKYGASGAALMSALSGAESWLELVINGNSLAPRQRLVSVPYAVVASSLIKEFQDALCPPGTIIAFGGTNIPNGWLLCDGKPYSAATYPKLFAAIGTAWGAGYTNGTKVADFNLPDLRGVFLRGVNGSRADAYADQDANTNRFSLFTGGNTQNHVGSFQQSTNLNHTHGYLDSTGHGQTGTEVDTYDSGSNDSIYKLDVSRTTGSSGGVEARPKNAYVHYLIKY